MQRENIGLLLYGDVGTGKSYGAACIANRLIEQSIPACMINLSTVLNSMGGFQSEEKNAYISDLMRYPLLILDDFGMERQTEYALEQVFNVIDARYRSGKPLIITTNLSLTELNAPKSLDHTRITTPRRGRSEEQLPPFFVSVRVTVPFSSGSLTAAGTVF